MVVVIGEWGGPLVGIYDLRYTCVHILERKAGWGGVCDTITGQKTPKIAVTYEYAVSVQFDIF